MTKTWALTFWTSLYVLLCAQRRYHYAKPPSKRTDSTQSDRQTGQRSLTQLVVEATYGITETFESTVLIARRHDVDVTDLLRTNDVAASSRDHPQSKSRLYNP